MFLSGPKIKYRGTGKIQDEGDNQLVDALANDHLPHRHGYQRRRFWFGSAFEDMRSGGVGCYHDVRYEQNVHALQTYPEPERQKCP